MRMTTTTSLRPTRMSFCMDLIRRLDSSERSIIPSTLSYSSYGTNLSKYQDLRCRSLPAAAHQLDVGAILLDLLYLDHHQRVHFGVPAQ